MSKNNKNQNKRENMGLTASKEKDHSEWYTQVILKSDMADYSAVSGCIVYKPYSYEVWEKIQEFFNEKIKKSGVKNAYFPVLIPESLLTKEATHVEGFAPEVAWVTHGGNTKLGERLAVRPTSETIMYDSYSKWIRSYNDLPLRINQWNSVVRWEFKHATPFLRGREFLWQEGHTVFATKKEAEAEVFEMSGYYKQIYQELLAVPVIEGRKTEPEKFAGADYSISCETFLPVKKAIQGCTSHHLGQTFAKAFDISFIDDKGEKKYGWQNSWGFTTRSIGVMIMMHGDDKGLVMPPYVAPTQIVIVPIIFEKTKKEVLKKSNELKKTLSKFKVHLDDRESYSAGWKFNEWELKGVPIRIELGPKDIEKKHVVVSRRDTGEKEFVKWENLKSYIETLISEIHNNMFNKAKKHIKDSLITVKNWDEFLKAVKDKKWIKANHCANPKCEEEIKEKTNGVKTNCIPFDQPKTLGSCVYCNKPSKYEVLFAKSY
ncbi:proline--tRNA ligase [archaeon]|jgi:prolyl-tRNA synthetase|nr:proline--tRNA ligase [archaeon]MBT4022000.1 proline--tRNA ligase [archaeon]MBT4273157.1 proline--tRNA ligase [archaeon]MBT4460862.1 proline--tRNA ligase [archaeon]MBT4858618.1 proline--tRNA ligase [archaeon]